MFAVGGKHVSVDAEELGDRRTEAAVLTLRLERQKAGAKALAMGLLRILPGVQHLQVLGPLLLARVLQSLRESIERQVARNDIPSKRVARFGPDEQIGRYLILGPAHHG